MDIHIGFKVSFDISGITVGILVHLNELIHFYSWTTHLNNKMCDFRCPCPFLTITCDNLIHFFLLYINKNTDNMHLLTIDLYLNNKFKYIQLRYMHLLYSIETVCCCCCCFSFSFHRKIDISF